MRPDENDYKYMLESKDPETGWIITEFLTEEEMEELESGEMIEKYDPDDDYE